MTGGERDGMRWMLAARRRRQRDESGGGRSEHVNELRESEERWYRSLRVLGFGLYGVPMEWARGMEA